jgi:hypothetical protein
MDQNTEKWDQIGASFEYILKTLAQEIGLVFQVSSSLHFENGTSKYMNVNILWRLRESTHNPDRRGEFRSLCNWNSQSICSRLSSN